MTTKPYSIVKQSDDDIEMNLVQLSKLKSDQFSSNSKMLHQIPLNQLCVKMIIQNMTWIFVLNILVNILLSSMLIPTLFKFSNDSFVKEFKVVKGIHLIVLAIICEILSVIHKNIIIEPQKRLFLTKVHTGLEEEVNKIVLLINWNKLRDLNKNEFERKKDLAKWNILSLITSIIGTFISLFSFFGYTFWIAMISPLSLIIYFGILFGLIYFYPKNNKKNSDLRHDLWATYSYLNTNLYTDIIHHNGDKSLEKITDCVKKIELARDEEKKCDSAFTDTINVVYNIGFIINCLVLGGSLSPSDVVIYIQYSCLMRNSVSMCIGIYNQYQNSYREYAKLEDIINKLDERIIVEPYSDYRKITIQSLKYVYPQDSNVSNKPFELTLGLSQKLEFVLGQIIRLDGNSGNGKSTFSDIINGVIPLTEYSSLIYLNDQIKLDGFDYLTTTRYYNEQQESISWKPSVYEIITGVNIEYDELDNPINLDLANEELVWKALDICLCLDFVKRENISNDLKWIHTKNIGMSGGQKGRVALARTVYRITSTRQKFVTLDEVDKSIQVDSVVNIMKNIFEYTKTNNILVFVICHSSEVKALDVYDQVINFDQGIISIT